MTTRTATRVEHLCEGMYFAEVEVEIIEDELGWSPGVTPEGAELLDRVRLALRAGDLATALRHAKIYTMTPIEPAAAE